MEQGMFSHILQPLFNHALAIPTASSSALPPPSSPPPLIPPSPPLEPLATKPAYRKRPHTGSNGLVRRKLHRRLGDAIMGGRVGIVGAGSVRTKPGSITNQGRAENSIAAKSLQFILAEELEHEKRVLEDLKTAVQAHLTQLHTEEIILSGMLDFNIEGVVVPKLPIREEMVMCGMGFGENEEGREYGSVGEGVDVEFQATVDVGVQEEVDEVQDERIEEDWARELEWEEETEEEEEEEEDGVNDSPVSFQTDFDSYYDEDQPSDEDEEEEDEEIARKALSMMLEQYGGGA